MTSAAVLIVDDDAVQRQALCDSLQSDTQPVYAADSGPRALELLKEKTIGLVISDLGMQATDGASLLRKIREQHPALPAVIMTAHGTIESAVDVMREGASDFIVKPFANDVLKQIVGRYIDNSPNADEVIAEDCASVELMRIAKRVAATDATVTISGESGCGKEIVARYIHEQSPRSAQDFVAINCAAIPENMLEAVLFGYEKGAFTGASSAHAGKFEQANHGTLLLDEISEMDLALQAKLLRVLQEKEVERIGGRKTLSLNVRVLATTNRDLRKYVANGKFREDLYYRLNVIPLHILPLRERRDDILPLAEMILRRHSDRRLPCIELSADARAALLAYGWPGNVRELENLMQRTTILSHGNTVETNDLAFEAMQDPIVVNGLESDLHQDLRTHEQQIILTALHANDGKRDAVARALGISPRTLRYKLARMREAGIQIPGEQHE